MPERSACTESSKNSSEFKASIIPYDTCEDSNAPILASSGDNINLIFSIPKESFRKLAVAAIAHLDSNSDFDHAGISNGSKSGNNKHERDSDRSKFRLSDVVNHLESENTKDIIDAYTEDGNTSESSKNVIAADSKSCVNGGSNGSPKVGESAPNDYEMKTQTPNSDIVDLPKDCETVDDIVEALSDCNPDLSDCPELESAWPDIDPFTETEKIPIEELESFVLNGFVTKYLKLELSNEFVLIKVTSESNVLVDAVKYKEKGKGSNQEMEVNFQDYNERQDLSRKESECSDDNGDISKVLMTDVCNKNVDSMDGTVSSMDENESRDSQDKFLENPNLERMCLKTEDLEELGPTIPVSSPRERLKFSLRESLNSLSGNTDAKREIEESVAETLVAFSLASEFSDKTSENDSQTQENILKESVDEGVTESSETCQSNEMTAVCHETEYSDKKSDTEKESPKIDSKQESMPPEEKPIENAFNETESIKVNEDSIVVGKLDLNDDFKSANTLGHAEETDKEKSFSKSEEKDSLDDSALGNDLHLSESEAINGSIHSFSSVSLHSTSSSLLQSISNGILPNNSCEPNYNEIRDTNDCTSTNKHDVQKENCEQPIEGNSHAEITDESIKLENSENSFDQSNINEEKDLTGNSLIDDKLAENSHETNTELKSELSEELKDEVKTEDDKENLIADTNVEATLNETSAPESSETHSKSLEKESLGQSEYLEDSVGETNIEEKLPESSETHSKSLEKESLEQSEYLEDSVCETTNIEEKLPENSFPSNLDSFMDSTIDTNAESASECGDLESDDIKSVASESDDSKDSDKQPSTRRNRFKKIEADEVDCAPTRTRRKAVAGLSRDAIPENTEVKNTKMPSSNTLIPSSSSEYSGKTSPIGRSLRSKSLDPTPQSSKSKVYDKKYSIESEESTRRTRAKTPDVIGKRDIKTTMRSSPRKPGRSTATAEPSSTSKAANTKTSGADSKSRANLDFSMSSKRSKRNSKD